MHIPQKIPTIVGIILTILIVGGIAVVSEHFFRTSTTASGSIQPANVQITNLSDTTFTVSWTTELPATGALSAQSSAGTTILFDDQDTTSSKGQGLYINHSVTDHAATPNTDYAVTILSNSKKNINGGAPYTVRTGPALTTQSGNLEPAYGTIVTDMNQPVGGALVYLTLDGGQILSTISKPSGTWLLPLNLVRTKNLTGYLSATDRTGETISVQVNGMVIHALTDTLNDSPVPNMSPGGTYDFRNLNAKAPGLSAVLGTTTTKPTNIVSLVIPADGAAVTTTLPLIQGTGVVGKTVALVLGITHPIGDTTIVGPDGVWRYTPKQPLAAGKQSVTVTTANIQNIPVAITHTFEILQSGTQVLGDATPSATPTDTTTPSPTDTLTPTPTTTPDLSASISATPDESTLAAQPVPTSGYDLPTILLLVLSVGLILGGGIVLIQ